MADSCADFEDEVGSGARRPESSTPVHPAGMQARGRATAPASIWSAGPALGGRGAGNHGSPPYFRPRAHAAFGLSPQPEAGGGRWRVQAGDGAADGPTAQEDDLSIRLPLLSLDATRRRRSPGLPLRRN